MNNPSPGLVKGYEFVGYESVSAYSHPDLVTPFQPQQTPSGYDDHLNLPMPSNSQDALRNCEEEIEFSDALRNISKALMDDDLEDISWNIHDSTLHAAELNLSELLYDASPFSSNRTHMNSDYNIICGSNDGTNSDYSFEAGTKYPGDVFSRERSLYQEEENAIDETRSTKHSKVFADESILNELFDKVLSLEVKNDRARPYVDLHLNNLAKGLYKELKYPKKMATKKKAADTRTLLMRCMQFVAENDHGSASKLLSQIRLCSSPSGDATQRLAHYFANSIEARMVGAGSKEHKALAGRTMSDPSVLKAYMMYLSSFPFMEISHSFVVETIMDQAAEASSLHIIHFGIMYGVRWPPLIQRLSTRPGGPPKLVITGIDLVEAGLQPDARVKEAGRLLTECCKNFKVPFVYNGIAKNWETMTINDFRITKGEVVVVDCTYLFMYLRDDTMTEHSPRDYVMRLIYGINPDIFIHGVVEGSYNSPFFVSRSREALYYFSTLFDMFEANLGRDDRDRMVFEREMLGKKILNVIACEGMERVERPETYKQWQVRTVRAGFKQLPLNEEVMKRVRDKVKSSYHKDFAVDEANQWLLIGWKGRVLHAHSCWKPG